MVFELSSGLIYFDLNVRLKIKSYPLQAHVCCGEDQIQREKNEK
jgi:hypothetical protein